MSTGKIKVVLGEPWENHRAGTTVEVDRSRGSWLLTRGGRAADEESARMLGVAWAAVKSAPSVKKKSAPVEKAATPKPAPVVEPQPDAEGD